MEAGCEHRCRGQCVYPGIVLVAEQGGDTVDGVPQAAHAPGKREVVVLPGHVSSIAAQRLRLFVVFMVFASLEVRKPEIHLSDQEIWQVS